MKFGRALLFLSCASLGIIAFVQTPAVGATSYVVLNATTRGSGLVRVPSDGSTAYSIADQVYGYGLSQEANGNFIVGAPGGPILTRVTRGGQVSIITALPAGSFYGPHVIDSSGNILVPDTSSKHRILRVAPDGSSTVTVATYPVAVGIVPSVSIVPDISGDFFVAYDGGPGPTMTLYRITQGGTSTYIPVSGLPSGTTYRVTRDLEGSLLVATSSNGGSVNPAIYIVSLTGSVSASAKLILSSPALCCEVVDLARDPSTGNIVALIKNYPFANVASNVNRLVNITSSGAVTTIGSGDQYFGDPSNVIVDSYAGTALAISPGSLVAAGATNAAYSQTLDIKGGNPPYTCVLASGTLPPGLTLASSCTVAGTPTSTGTWAFTVRAIDTRFGSASQLLSLTVASGPSVARPISVTNGASFMSTTSVSPGEIIAVFGHGIGPDTPAGLQLDSAGRVAASLSGTRVLFDAMASPLIYVSSSQVSAVVPYGIAGKSVTTVQVDYQGTVSDPLKLAVANSIPAIFSVNASGKGQGAILNQDYKVNSTTSPADVGSVISIYATGEGQTNPDGIDGQVAGDSLPKPQLPVSVSIGGVAAAVLYAGAAPGAIAGLLQVNVRVPEAVQAGAAVPVLLTVGSATSQPGISVAVSQPQPVVALSSLSFSAGSVAGGSSVTGTVALTLAAPPGGAVITLRSSGIAVVVPSTITVPSGQTSASFTATTAVVPSSQTVTITATYGSDSRSALLTVNPPSTPTLSGLSLSSSSVTGGTSVTGTIRLSGPAPTVGAAVTLQVIATEAGVSAAASAPASVAVAAGASSATFTITTSAVTSSQTLTITATYAGVTQTATLTINAPAVTLASLSLSSSSVTGGTSVTGTVRLSGPAPTGGAVVTLVSSGSAATVPPSVTVAAGLSSATFTITTSTVTSNQAIVLLASYGGAGQVAHLSVNVAAAPPPFLSLNAAPVTFQPSGFSAIQDSLSVLPNAGNTTFTATINLFTLVNGVATNQGKSFSFNSVQSGGLFVAGSTVFNVSSASLTFTLSEIVNTGFNALGSLSGTLSVTGTPVGGGSATTLSGAISGQYAATLR